MLQDIHRFCPAREGLKAGHGLAIGIPKVIHAKALCAGRIFSLAEIPHNKLIVLQKYIIN
jgi:hypothetical protein